MDEQIRILCVDDETNVLHSLERIFMDETYEILTAGSGEEGLSILAGVEGVQVVISDYRMPGMNGIDFLKEVCHRWPDTVRIVLSGYADTGAVVAAINEGQIYKFIPKPWNDDELRVTIAKAIETFILRRKNIQLAEELQQANEELQQMNENLEKLVIERTSELVLQNRALVHARNILLHLPVGVVALVTDGVVVQCNREAAVVLDRDCEEIMGEKMSEVFPPELCEFIIRLVKGEETSTTMTLNGEKVHAKGYCIVEDDQQGIIVALNRGYPS